MLLRAAGESHDAVICIGQASHALVSGQLARAWGNGQFEPPEPNEAVCLAAEQHDLGMAEWDRAPELDAATGRPQPFTGMALRTHLSLWSAAPGRLLTQNRYAALLISLHGTTLYALRGHAQPARRPRGRAVGDGRGHAGGWMISRETRSDPPCGSGRID